MRAVLFSALCLAASTALAQAPVGALAIDERQGDQYGWAVDYETPAAARAAALRECGAGCSVVLEFERCGAYAADQDADSTAVGWAESYDSADVARQVALSECGSRGGAGCTVRAWGCNGHVAEEQLSLDRIARQEIQQGLRAAGFDPGGTDGLFGPRTRSAIRSWQADRSDTATGYLNGAAVEALGVSQSSAATAAVAPTQPPEASAELEGLFWQSVMNSTDPADFEAYLRRFPDGLFVELAQNRLTALRREPPGDVRAARRCAGQGAGGPCWMELANQPGCYVWNPSLTGPAPGATVTWSGQCLGGLAQGTGSLTWVWDSNGQVDTGRLQDGEQTGHWVLRYANGDVGEGPYVAGEQTGHWVFRNADGAVAEGPLVASEANGHWVNRFADGEVHEGLMVDGERHGDWIIRWPAGNTTRHRYANGELVEVR